MSDHGQQADRSLAQALTSTNTAEESNGYALVSLAATGRQLVGLLEQLLEALAAPEEPQERPEVSEAPGACTCGHAFQGHMFLGEREAATGLAGVCRSTRCPCLGYEVTP